MDIFSEMTNFNTVDVYFIQDGASCSKEMREAYIVCQDAKLHPKIISEDSACELGSTESNIVFVIDSFSGQTFDHLSKKPFLVVGPSCISTCLKDKIPIPNNGSPVFNIALRGTVISSTKLHSKEREEIKKLSGFMGSVYSEDLTLAVTHLIAERGFLSGKCSKAVENNIPVISPEWIKKSWELSQIGTKAPDPLNFKLLPFKGMCISCSNLSTSVKNKLKQLIESNGGIYQPNLEMKKTAVLIIGDAEGKKWQYAQQWEIPCLLPSWIYECVEKGVLVPSKDHIVSGRPRCSTPTHSSDNDSFMSANISAVPFAASEKSNIEDTNTSFGSEFSVRSVQSAVKPARPIKDYKGLLEKFVFSEIKEAGLFLDGCKVFLSGFTPSEFDKLKKVINYGGAALFPKISDELSHVIVGEFSVADAKELSGLNPRPHVVNLEWLLECIKEKNPANVEDYLCLKPPSAPPPSPLSTKGLKLLRGEPLNPSSPATPSNESRANVSRKLFVKANVAKSVKSSIQIDSPSIDVSALEKCALEEMNKEKEEQVKRERELERLRREAEEEAERLRREAERQREVGQRTAERANESSANETEQSTTDEPFFQGLWFEILIYGDVEAIHESIEIKGGKIVTKPEDPTPDYAIVPVEGTTVETAAKNIVSPIFLDDCYDQGCLVTDLEYYHRAIPQLVDCKKKLEGTVFALSGFSRAERRLLEYIATTLGALVQAMFSRSEYPDKGVRKSTHLLCYEMSGKKYEAALKWGVPVVTSSWLLDLIEPSPVAARRSSTSILSQSFQGGENDGMDIDSAGIREGLATETFVAPPPRNPLKRVSDELSSKAEGPDTLANRMSPSSPPELIKRWKSNEMGNSPKAKRPHGAPSSVMMKQLWAQCGGVPFDGIEPETGKLLRDGPYAEYASNVSPATQVAGGPSTPKPPGGSSGEATPTTKRWKNFVNAFSCFDSQESTSDLPKPRRPSTPLDVLKKQLWVQCGGLNLEGLEPGTGKPLRDGPYSEWARNSMSPSNSLLENNEKSLPSGSKSDISNKQEDPTVQLENYIRDDKNTPKQSNTFFRSSSHSKFPQEATQKIPETEVSHLEDTEAVLLNFLPAHSSTVCEGMGGKRSLETCAALNNRSSKSKDTVYKENIPANNSVGDVTKEKKSSLSELPQTDKSTELKVFVLSGISVAAKEKYEGIIRNLGGGVAQSPIYDPSSTHIIIEKPIRNEKLLCCIAAGKWVLHTSYIDYCYESRQFLPEEEFEWGNPLSSSRLPRLEPGSTEAGFAEAAYKWRIKKKDMGSAAPFREMQVVLYTTETKAPQFNRLLEAGGASVLPKSEILNANFVIWEHEKVKMDVPLSQLASLKIHVVQPIYIAESLVKAPPPSQHYPPPYLKVMKERKASR